MTPFERRKTFNLHSWRHLCAPDTDHRDKQKNTGSVLLYFANKRVKMPKVKRSRKPPPDGWELIEPTLDELDQKMREGKPRECPRASGRAAEELRGPLSRTVSAHCGFCSFAFINVNVLMCACTVLKTETYWVSTNFSRANQVEALNYSRPQPHPVALGETVPPTLS